MKIQIKGIRIASLFMAMLLAGMLIMPVASAHFLGYSAVDGMEIRYGRSTQYTTAQSHSLVNGMTLVKSTLHQILPGRLKISLMVIIIIRVIWRLGGTIIIHLSEIQLDLTNI